MENMVKSKNKILFKFWKNKRILVTGHTGFKGSWLCIILKELGANIIGYSLEPNTNPNLYSEAKIEKDIISIIGDIRDYQKFQKCLDKYKPEIIIHMAAQPLVRYSYKYPIETFSTNVMGTLNVLQASRYCKSLKSVVIVTTDKCYENIGKKQGYKENDPMGGYDPYSSSKGCCELLISSYRRSYFNNKNTPNIASVRAGNVIGGGDWSNDRLIPDILKCFENSKTIKVRNPKSVRPWQHVIEPLFGYLILTQNLTLNFNQFSEGWNFGPDDENCKSVEWILKNMIKLWDKKFKWEFDNDINPHEASFLKLDCSKAKEKLDWRPLWDLEYSLKLIVEWHKKWLLGKNVKHICKEQINQYIINLK